VRALIIDNTAKADVQRVLDYALDRNHWYRPGKDSRVPGDDPNFVAHLRDGFRCVFTITENRGLIYRHLSISVPAHDKYPHVAAALTIAELFGFTGWDGKTIDQLPDGWMVHLNKDEHCIALGQPFEKAKVMA